METVSWIATALSMLGAILIARKSVVGFYFWIVSNCLWVGVDLHKGIPAQAVLFVFYTATCAYGIWKWGSSEDDRGRRNPAPFGDVDNAD